MKRFTKHLNEMSQAALQKKLVGLDTRIDKHSNPKRVTNTGGMSSAEFKKLVSKVADSDVEVVAPNTGDNKSSAYDMFSFELDGKSMSVTLSNPVAGRGSASTDSNEESLMLVMAAMYNGAKDKDSIILKCQEATTFKMCVDKDGKEFTVVKAKELVAYLQEKDDWFDSHLAQAKVFKAAFTKPKRIEMDRSSIDVWTQAKALFQAEDAWGGKNPDKDKWNPADIWIYYEDLPKHDNIDDLNKYLYDSVIKKQGIVGISLKKGTGKLSYINAGENPEIKVNNIKSQFGKNFTLGVDMEFLGDGIPPDFSLYFRIFQATDTDTIRGEGTGKNAMQGKVKLDMLDILSGGKYAERIKNAGGPNILKWDNNKKEYELTPNGLKKFKSVEKKWKKMRRWKNIRYKRGSNLAQYERAFAKGVVGFLNELNKGKPKPGNKDAYIPWKENQGKSMINSRFQTIEMVWLLNKMPLEQQNNLAAGLIKFAKSMSDWSAAHAKLQ